MELRHLNYFITLAEELNFGKAAKRLNISQPPLSRQIHDLEKELGFDLFIREKRNTKLSIAGKEFLKDAHAVMESMKQLQTKADLYVLGHTATIKISSLPTMATSEFALLLKEFGKKMPGIDLSIYDYSSKAQLAALQDGTIDVGFLSHQENLPKQFDSLLIHRLPMQLAVPEDHPFTLKERVTWTELKNEEFILLTLEEKSKFYQAFYDRCHQAKFEPIIRHYVNAIGPQLWAVSAGLGIAPLPSSRQFSLYKGVSFVSLPKNAPFFETVMIWRKNEASAALKEFINFVKSNKSKLQV